MVLSILNIVFSSLLVLTFNLNIFGVVLGTFLAAVAVPDLGALIALLGALTGSILSLIAPALINRRCPREKGGWECVADGMTILIGVIGGTLGTYQAFLNVVNGGDISE